MLVVVAVTALVFVVNGQASPAALETEAGTVSGSAVAANDSSASNASAVKFGVATANTTPPPGGTQLVVDFRTATQPLDSYSVGATISTFNGAGIANINASATWKANLKDLGPLAWLGYL
ncbi:MAG: hypothetical protein WAQ27_02770 [Candidatus Microsaccharimonas sp.]